MTTDLRLVSLPAAAKLLGVSLKTMRALVREGRVPTVRLQRQVRVAMPALIAFAGAAA